MKSYLKMLQTVLDEGIVKSDRTGTGTRSIFGYHWSHNMADGFPLLTTKKIHVKSVLHELLWFLRGETNVRSLQADGVTIWDEWADRNGDLGPVYGCQWRKWNGDPGFPISGPGIINGVDQIAELIRMIRENPDSRRQLVTAWNPSDIPEMKLPPCHLLFQTCVEEDYLSLQMYQRSADLFLGVPFNIASYAFLLEMLARVTGLMPGRLSICFGDLHIYLNHLDQVKEQLSRTPGKLPDIAIRGGREEIDDIRFEDISIIAYRPQPSIKAPIAV